MNDPECVQFLQWALPHLRMRWPGFRKVRRQVCKRIKRRLQDLELPDLVAYRDYLNDRADEWMELDHLCRISISRFYRDRAVFDLIGSLVLPRLAAAATDRDENQIRAWSAGCASGEEPFTLKIIWELEVQPKFPETCLSITATDTDPQLLARAEQALYPASSLKDLPNKWCPVAFEQSNNQWHLRDRFRQGIEFLAHDIRDGNPPGLFDLIFCRHLAFTYFDQPLQQLVLRQMLGSLRGEGVLVTGKQETLPEMDDLDLPPLRPRSGIYLYQHAGRKTDT